VRVRSLPVWWVGMECLGRFDGFVIAQGRVVWGGMGALVDRPPAGEAEGGPGLCVWVHVCVGQYLGGYECLYM